MKNIINNTLSFLCSPALLLLLFFNTNSGNIMAQSDGATISSENAPKETVAPAKEADQPATEAAEPTPKKYKDKKTVKTPFKSIWLIDNATTTVPVKNTVEFDIQHRFGTFLNGYKDFFGIYAAANIRFGVQYTPINDLMIGFGFTKERLQWDFNVKYAIVKQKKGGNPINVTYFGNIVIDTRGKSNFRHASDRFSYFNQLIFSSKTCEYFSLQVAPSITWYNNVEGYVDTEGNIKRKMLNYHFAISMLGRIQVNKKMAITVGYDQPLTKHTTNNPDPNISLGLEMSASGHSFQVFIQNYHGILQQSSNFYNDNNYRKGAFLIGFNITRLWNL